MIMIVALWSVTNNITIKSHGDSQVSKSWRFYYEVTKSAPLWQVIRWLNFLSFRNSSQTTIIDDFSMESPNEGHMNWWLQCKVPWLLLTKQSHCGFSVGGPNVSELRVIMRGMVNITFQLIVVTVTLVTICDVQDTSHRIPVLFV